MSERYTKIFSHPENVYATGSPVIIKAGTLLKDNETNWIIAQLKLENISNKAIKIVKVELKCFDSVGRSIGAPVCYEYLDLYEMRGSCFGSKNPIKISDSTTRSYTATVVEVGFADNQLWNSVKEAPTSFPSQSPITTLISDPDALRGYRERFGKGATLVANRHSDLWLCTCGAINHSGEDRCYKCNSAIAELESLDTDALRIEGIYSSACELLSKSNISSIQKAKAAFEQISEYKDSAELKNKCDEKAKETKRNKNKKSKLAMVIAGGVAALCLIGYFVAYPLIEQASGNFAPIINMYKIKDYTIPNGVTAIDNLAFYNFDSLERVVIPDSVTSIGNSAFYGCDNLTSVVIGDSVTSIGDSAFSNCTSLTSVVIGDSATSIGSWAFSDCTSLTSIEIPDSVTSIGDRAFYGCTSLTSIEIPDSVTSIGDRAFSDCTSLTSVVIGDSVTSIGGAAFWSCDNLTSVVIGDSVTSIGDSAFWSCDNLTSVVIGDSVTSIGDSAFYDCDSLTSIVIPDSVTSIGSWAFYGCTSLTSVVIGDSVTSIGSWAFSDCTSLTSIKYRGTEKEWNVINLYGSGLDEYKYTITYNYTGQ